MKYLWIAALLLFVVLAAGAWWAASQPGFWIGLAGALVTAALPILKHIKIGTPIATNKPIQRMKRIRERWGK